VKIKLLTLVFFFSAACSYSQSNYFEAEKGIIYVDHEVLKEKPMPLDGEWAFYWKKFVDPEYLNINYIEDKIYAEVPKNWTKADSKYGDLLPKGFGTYHLKIKGLKPDETYMLKVQDVFTSYQLYINNILVAESGTAGKTNEETDPVIMTREVPVNPGYIHNGTIDLVLHVSNFDHTKAGVMQSILIGTPEIIMDDTKNTFILDFIIIGLILIIGINHLFYFIFRPKDRSNLYFGILCLVMIIRNISTNYRFLTHWSPDMNFELLFKLDNFSGFGTIPLFALFFYILYRKEFSRLALQIIVGLGVIISLFIFFTPTYTYNQFQLFYQVYLLTGGLYISFFVLLKAALRQRPGSTISFIAFIVLFGTAINDVLSNMGVIQSAYIAPYGLAFFMVSQSLLMISRSSKAINQNEHLSGELISEKENLEKKIAQRTNELSAKFSELEEHKAKEQQQSWYNEGMAKIGDVISKEKDDFNRLTRRLLTTLVKQLDALMGAIYVTNDENEEDVCLELVAHYGCDKEKIEHSCIYPGETLVGATFKEKKINYFTDIPEEYTKITSGLGETHPRCLILVPMMMDEEIIGVIEIGSLKEINEFQRDLISKVAENIASTIFTTRISQKTQRLLEQTREQTQELQTKEEEMRQNMEELMATQEEMERIKVEDAEKHKNEREHINKQKEDFENILDEIPGKIYLKDRDGKYVYVNQEFLRFYGKKKEEIMDKTDFDIMTEEKATNNQEQERSVLENGTVKLVESHRFNNKNVIYETLLLPFKLRSQDEEGILGIKIEITEKVQLEEKIKKLSDELKKLSDN